MILNNREWATLIWLGIGLGIIILLVILKRDFRTSIGNVLRIALDPVILVPVGIMLGYVVLEVWIASEVSLWRSDLAKDTVIWVVASGLVLLVNFKKASEEPHFFRHKIIGAFGVTALLEFFVNISVLSLIGEFLLQPILVFLILIAAVADHNNRFSGLKKLADVMLAVIGFVLVAFTVSQLHSGWNGINKHFLFLEFALPIWLTIGFLPFVFSLSLYANYEKAFKFINYETDNRLSRRRAKLALVTELRFRTRDIDRFSLQWARKIGSAPNFGAARLKVADFQQSRREAEQAVIDERERLRRYAGSDETDNEGRRLDRREFKETIAALRWLGTCQMGRYRNQGGQYQANLLDVLNNDFTRQGLPRESGITMKVAKDGQSWYAWRRTVTGWYFAIGAAGPPPDQWEYDGQAPPRDFPGKDRSWGDRPFSNDVNRNWGL